MYSQLYIHRAFCCRRCCSVCCYTTAAVVAAQQLQLFMIVCRRAKFVAAPSNMNKCVQLSLHERLQLVVRSSACALFLGCDVFSLISCLACGSTTEYVSDLNHAAAIRRIIVFIQIAGVASAAPCVATPWLLRHQVPNGKNCCWLIESDSIQRLFRSNTTYFLCIPWQYYSSCHVCRLDIHPP